MNKETIDQIAAVMLQHGTQEQQEEALRYAAGGQSRAGEGEAEANLTTGLGAWISVDDRLPPFDEAVLAHYANWGGHGKNMLVARYVKVLGWWDIRRDKSMSGATHWMPLPEVPNGQS